MPLIKRYVYCRQQRFISRFSFFFQVKPKAGKSAVIKNFHSQYYANGSECDLTGKARETQIKVFITLEH